jgi:heterodisulfide reductase subunit A2
MKEDVRTGIFLCRCGNTISDQVDMEALENGLTGTESVVSVQCSGQYCTAPGLAELLSTVEEKGLNRVLLGACSERIMKPKISKALQSSGLSESQIELVNLKDNVAMVHEEPKTELTRKAAVLLSGAVASLRSLEPQIPAQTTIEGPALILGGGISGFEAARELSRNQMESILVLESESPEAIVDSLPEKYPGSRLYYEELKTLVEEVMADPMTTIVPSRPIEYMDGHVGDYHLGLIQPGGSVREITGSALILAMDRENTSERDAHRDSGNRMLDQLELEVCLVPEESASANLQQERIIEMVVRQPERQSDVAAGFGELSVVMQEALAESLTAVQSQEDSQVMNQHLDVTRQGGGTSFISGTSFIQGMDRKLTSGRDSCKAGGKNMMDQLELEGRMAREEITSGNVVFLVNDKDSTQKTRELSTLAAWNNSLFLAKKYPEITATVLYPSDIRLPLTGADLASARSQRVHLQTYSPKIEPVVESGGLTFVSPQDQAQHKMMWDALVVSSTPAPSMTRDPDIIRYLPVFSSTAGLQKLSLRVKPRQAPVDWAILAGSAQQPCSINEARHQGKQAARKVLGLKEKSKSGQLAAPLSTATVDQDVCVGCGLCNEICPTGAMENIRPGQVAIPRKADPLACVGCGSCVAACPHGAIKLVNNTAMQLEERVKAVVSQMKETDVLGFACSWGGQGAAELAAVQNLTYPSRLFMIPVPCLGSIDPTILSMAFVNGANFIMLAGCPPHHDSTCHYGHGVDHTWFRVNVVKKLLNQAGLDPERISLDYVDVNEPEVFVKMANSFLSEADRLGPIHRSEKQRKLLLAAHATLHLPRTRWVLGTCLRRPSEVEFRDEQQNEFAFDQVVQEVVEQEFLASRIVGVLNEVPTNPPSIAEALGEPPLVISKALDMLVKDKRAARSWDHPYTLFALPGSN